MPLSTKELWDAALTRIRSIITEQQFETWFRNLSCDKGARDEEIVIQAPNRFSSSWLTDHYLKLIETCASECRGADRFRGYHGKSWRSDWPLLYTGRENLSYGKPARGSPAFR